ncbi:MAG: iron-binding protein [Sphingomonas bacterium]|nr:iron-binding protein [Sphingomonas bacterium]MDB5684669.1 iron-binding protein [Sphingomonas bacterium]
MTIQMKTLKNGPIKVSGDLSLLQLSDSNGMPHDLTGKSSIFLCRCGASITKPFCDGQHSKIGFQAAEAAVQADQSSE